MKLTTALAEINNCGKNQTKLPKDLTSAKRQQNGGQWHCMLLVNCCSGQPTPYRETVARSRSAQARDYPVKYWHFHLVAILQMSGCAFASQEKLRWLLRLLLQSCRTDIFHRQILTVCAKHIPFTSEICRGQKPIVLAGHWMVGVTFQNASQFIIVSGHCEQRTSKNHYNLWIQDPFMGNHTSISHKTPEDLDGLLLRFIIISCWQHVYSAAKFWHF